MLEPAYRRATDDLRREIDDLLSSVGLLCRVFGRAKSKNSLERKLQATPGKYSSDGKMVQDAIGVRIIVYFPEDISIAASLLKSRYECDERSSTIDAPTAREFSVTRHNLIFRAPSRLRDELAAARGSTPLDTTFEVQIRTILSEGWHEVEHDLRYKRQSDWEGYDDLARSLNGVVATLETAEWSMRTIFDELAYRHYKAGNWEAMLHGALRMRISSTLSPAILDLLTSDVRTSKALLRLNRFRIFDFLSRLAPRIPLTLDNIVYVWGHQTNHTAIVNITPPFLRETFSSAR